MLKEQRMDIKYKILNQFDFENQSEDDARKNLKKALNKLYQIQELGECGLSEATDLYIDITMSINNCGLTADELTALTERELKNEKLKDVACTMKRSTFFVFNVKADAFNKLLAYIRRNTTNE